MFRIQYVGAPSRSDRPVSPEQISRVVQSAVALALDSERAVTFTLTTPLAMEAQPWKQSMACSVLSKQAMHEEAGADTVQEAAALMQQAFKCSLKTATHNTPCQRSFPPVSHWSYLRLNGTSSNDVWMCCVRALP